MTLYYADSVKGFFDSEINDVLPDDALVITEKVYATLLNGQTDGKVLGLKKGKPALVDAPAQSAEELQERAEVTKANLLTLAKESIAPLQDAADLGVATEEESARLTAWKTFRVSVNRVDTAATDIIWPEVPADVA